jgi:hypothetical protein
LSAYHPAPNRAKRTNQDVIRMIAMFLNDSQGQWDKNLQKFALALRTMANESTQVSPALLNLGREIALPIDRVLQAHPSQNYDQIASQLSNEVPQLLSDLIQKARQNVSNAHIINKKYFDLKRRERSFKVGDRVWVRNHQLSNADTNTVQKFLPKWIGPYRILSEFENTYKLDLEPRMIPKRLISDLKPFVERDGTQTLPISILEKKLDEQPKIPTKSRVNYRNLAGLR